MSLCIQPIHPHLLLGDIDSNPEAKSTTKICKKSRQEKLEANIEQARKTDLTPSCLGFTPIGAHPYM